MDLVDKNKWFSSAYVPEEGSGIKTRQSSDALNLKIPAVKTAIYGIFYSTDALICGMNFYKM